MQNKGEVDYSAPIYLQLRELIRSKIEDGEYQRGIAIPSEHELMQMYEVNRSTVRIAVDELVNEGLLIRVQGKGVYVVSQIERDLEDLGGFTQTMHKQNVQSKKKILLKKRRLAGLKYARIFNIKADDYIYHVKRLDYGDGDPIAIQDVYIPEYLVPNLEEIDIGVFGMYEIYGFYHIVPIRAWQTLDLIQLSKADARLLDVGRDEPVFLFCCTTYDEEERVIEYSRSYTRGDKCNFTVKFANDIESSK
ncbi:GntR family transcriptional regulator [Ohessyouella blattaphilus]|uniref:GntR family transcriptional regulator n=1 Tax=Ohessyouella blattaphilus TaxID=2949333 RepID=A0ABT1EI73_9FIRM|nr:GntR family transcriptional regulator [Ohessyouella blattaphilus]MCP1110383.1 GntR family transcriptional regulator [Ohessyouella blattaphilus]MCR8563777.1 GntR family transcriptional regulator [Ohessyouella blattaphilus]